MKISIVLAKLQKVSKITASLLQRSFNLQKAYGARRQADRKRKQNETVVSLMVRNR